MPSSILEVNHVFKKFRKGEIHDSLRDLIPALAGKLGKAIKGNSLGMHEFWALSDVTFGLEKGESVGIIGNNGAGKSTILKLLSGIMKPSIGNIRVSGVLSSLIEVGAGFHPDLTGRENIYLNGAILGMKTRDINRQFDEIVDFSGLSEFIDTPVKRYSSGMYARLGFAVAAHVNPEILLIDEVLSVGDYAFQRKCLEKMKSVLREGVTVIFISHNLHAVMELCDRTILLDHGRIVMDGASNEVVNLYLSGLQENGRESMADKLAFISRAAFVGESTGRMRFQSGEKVCFEVEVTGRSKCEDLSVNIVLSDEKFDPVFACSTQELNKVTLSLDEGEIRKVTFEMRLHLGPGTYYLSAYIHRFDLQKHYDAVFSAATIFVSSNSAVRGIANLYPTAIIE